MTGDGNILKGNMFKPIPNRSVLSYIKVQLVHYHAQLDEALGTRCGWVDQGSEEYKVCPELLYMTCSLQALGIKP